MDVSTTGEHSIVLIMLIDVFWFEVPICGSLPLLFTAKGGARSHAHAVHPPGRCFGKSKRCRVPGRYFSVPPREPAG